uniref:Translocation associated membrane protein 2 n=1 Tax=Ursus americanus TaxID=9643 RepID=A0A452RE44_URSAM
MAFRRRTKSYPLFSQEFVIHNHADIGFCLVLCVLIGLMFEVSETGEGVPLSCVGRRSPAVPAGPRQSRGAWLPCTLSAPRLCALYAPLASWSARTLPLSSAPCQPCPALPPP